LTAHGVDGHDGALDRHHVEERRYGDDFVGLFHHFDLSKRWRAAKAETIRIGAFAPFF
jgi:hypothetical protein